MAQKFIINDGQLYFANVQFHCEILKDNSKTIGGGWWNWDREENKLYVYGTSSDFGSVTKEQIIEAWEKSLISPFWEKVEVIYSPFLTLYEVQQFKDKQIKLPINEKI